MQPADWIIVGIYVVLVVGMSGWLSRRQKSQADYYLAGRKLGAWPIALSIVATQCSANSLIGAPAFIAIKPGGGLGWLQYELAVPLATIAVLLLVPVFFRRHITTIYEVVEDRFGVGARSALSGIFLFSRALGTAVTLYATALVVSACLDWPLWLTLLFVGAISILYTTLGGIEADIYSDILQLVVLYAGTVVCIVVVIKLLGGFPTDFSMVEASRLEVVDFKGTGLGDGKAYSFWPMLIGGFFLYISYYGCDQSQAQRLLSAKDQRTAQKALLLNGVLRFPLVCTYCLFGLLLAVWLTREPMFPAQVLAFAEKAGQKGDFNYLVPLFILTYVPTGIRGVIIAAIIAATMSSLDSAINSLSAATQRDFLDRFVPGIRTRLFRSEVLRARLITVFWGVLCTGFAFAFASGGEVGAEGRKTVLELVNMVGSAVYGPILAVFVMTLLARRAPGSLIVLALFAGVGQNMFLWQVTPQISWFWWNVAGCLLTLAIALAGSAKDPNRKFLVADGIGLYGSIMVVVSVAIFDILLLLDKLLG